MISGLQQETNKALPEYESDLTYNVPVIELHRNPVTGKYNIPPAGYAREVDAILRYAFEKRMDDRMKHHQPGDGGYDIHPSPYGVFDRIYLAYVKHSGLPRPELAVWYFRGKDDQGIARMEFEGYADWMPWTREKLRRWSERTGYVNRCRHAWNDWFYHGIRDDRCKVNGRGEHWITNCPGQGEYAARVAAYALPEPPLPGFAGNVRPAEIRGF